MELITKLNDMACCCSVCDDLKGLFINTNPISPDVYLALFDETNGCSRTTLANLLGSSIVATDDQNCADKKKIGSIDVVGTVTEFFESVTSFGTPVVDVTDPNNVKVTLSYTNENCTAQDIEFTIPIPSPVSVYNSIDLKFDANGDLIVEAVYTDDAGNQTTITDTTPVTLPANEDYVEYTGNNTVPTGTPPNGVDTRVLSDGSRYDWDGTQWILANTPCPAPMTRAALIALRDAGGLDPQCHYIVTDPAPNGTMLLDTVLIHAIDTNTLSGCYLKVPHDNTAWVGSYDIDTNRVEKVFDHLNRNEVIGNGAIIVFPFGNASVTNNVVHHSTLTVTGGTVTGNNISGSSNVTVSLGSFINNTVITDANVTSAGNTVRNTFGEQSNTTINSGDFRENKVIGDATVVSSTTGDVDNNTFGNLSNTTINGGNFDNNVVMTDANVTVTAGTVTTNTFKAASNTSIIDGTFIDNTVGQDAQVTIRSGSNYENNFGNSTIYNQVGTGYIRYSTIEGTTTWTNGNTNLSSINSYVSTVNTTGSTGTLSNSTFDRALMSNLQNIPSLTITDSTISNYATIQSNGAARIYLFRSTVTDGSRVLCSAGSRIDASYTHLNSYSYLQSTGNGGYLQANYCNLSSLGYIRNTTTNTNLVLRCQVSSNSSIRFDGTANNCRVYYSSVSDGGSIYHTGTSNGCYIYYGSVQSYGQIYTENSVNTRMYYNNANSRGYVRSLNCPATHYMYYCNASASGYVQMSNAGGRMYSINASSQSIVEKRGAAGNIYYSNFDAYFYAYITRTAGTSSGLFGMGRSTQTVTTPTTVAPFNVGSAWLNFN